MNWNFLIIVILFVINFPVYRFIFRLFFSDADDFDESVRYSFTPNFISFFRGEYLQDKLGTMRLKFFVFICVVVIVVEFMLINQLFDFININFGK
ncbi:hypothetical protein E1757_06190 [Paenibacillus piri]|uniref:Uncharacterized protein n=1 Tax=Paenibacillus piri TaxID=2547395 RepID=A0A4R5KW92_9BACL|nr:hypothetical protein E1757_06190 [Paenibacillus piri]